MRRLRILVYAVEEALEAAAWYEKERPGLGEEFHSTLDAALDLLEEEIIPLSVMPGVAGSKGIKRLILKRFPYDIVVKESPHEIIVLAIAHQSRNPGYWRSRLQS